jgi:hypothetical protein
MCKCTYDTFHFPIALNWFALHASLTLMQKIEEKKPINCFSCIHLIFNDLSAYCFDCIFNCH